MDRVPRNNGISIHSLRVEGDPRSPTSAPSRMISIHSLRVEGDGIFSGQRFGQGISIHSLRVEGDLLPVQ